jgi:cyclase
MGMNMHGDASRTLYQLERQLRNNATSAEDILWGYLKKKPLCFKFRRQHPYSVYILDFYCHRLKLVIELDGGVHDIEDVKQNDIIRQRLLEKEGMVVMRFRNEQVEKDLNGVMKIIEEFLRRKTNE